MNAFLCWANINLVTLYEWWFDLFEQTAEFGQTHENRKHVEELDYITYRAVLRLFDGMVVYDLDPLQFIEIMEKFVRMKPIAKSVRDVYPFQKFKGDGSVYNAFQRVKEKYNPILL